MTMRGMPYEHYAESFCRSNFRARRSHTDGGFAFHGSAKTPRTRRRPTSAESLSRNMNSTRQLRECVNNLTLGGNLGLHGKTILPLPRLFLQPSRTQPLALLSAVQDGSGSKRKPLKRGLR